MNEGPIRIEALADQEEMEELFKQSVEELEPAMDLTVNDERAEVLVFITPQITNRAFLRCE